MSKPSSQTVFLSSVIVVGSLALGYVLWAGSSNGVAGGPKEAHSRLTLANIPFDGARAYEYLEQICSLGPRVSGSTGMQAQQKMLAEHFQKLGGTVEFQQFRVRHPLDGSAVPMANLIVHWQPDRKQRILLCAAHYDTRPYPDRDPVDRQGPFIGANDGGSGAAVLMELGHKMADLPGKLGVDFVLFDGEELVFQDRDQYFLGSEYFAQQYVSNPPPYTYRWGVLLDMVGDANLQIFQERASATWRDTKPLVKAIWDTARRLGVREFIAQKGAEVRDDHLPLHNTAKIPTCDIIDFDYPAWHTQGDTADKCSALSLAKVGWVIGEWLHTAVRGE